MPRPLRILIAPDAFKECMTGQEAAEAIERGVKRAADERSIRLEIDQCPVSDGGDGFVDAYPFLAPPAIRRPHVVGPMGESVQSRYAVGRAMVTQHDLKGTTLREARVAVIGMSDAAGLALVPRDRRDPERATTFGVGELIRHALGEGVDEIIVGLGNSATCDGGAGAAAALGVRFRDEFQRAIDRPTGADLVRIRSIEAAFADTRLQQAVIHVLCDVDTPMLGHDGTARLFAPQKGATPEQVERLEAGLENYARVVKKCLGYRTHPRDELTGAAGGLAWGLTQEWCPLAGNDLTSAVLPFSSPIPELTRDADLVLTGCGQIDRTDPRGKSVATVANIAHHHAKPCLLFVGALGPAWNKRDAGCDTPPQHAITPPTMPLDEALRRGPELLEAVAERVVRDWLASHRQ